MQNKCGSISNGDEVILFFYSFRWLSHFNSYFAMVLIHKHTHKCHLFCCFQQNEKRVDFIFEQLFEIDSTNVSEMHNRTKFVFLAFFCTAMCVIFVWKSAEMGMCVRNKRITEKSTIYEEKRNQVSQTSNISGGGNGSPRVGTFFSRYFHLVTPTMLTGFC